MVEFYSAIQGDEDVVGSKYNLKAYDAFVHVQPSRSKGTGPVPLKKY